MAEFKGKVALVTGGGSGIGLAAAHALARAGATVAVMGRDGAKLSHAVADIGPESSWAVAGDVGSEEDVLRVVNAVTARFGRLDVAVNAAGTGFIASLVEQNAEDWSMTLRTNLDGAMYCIKHQAAAMIQGGHGGSIVNVSSIAGKVTHRLMSAYCVSKAGLEMLTRCAADELGPHLIRVNALRPGLVPTDLSRILADHPKVRSNYEAHMPLGRLGKVDEVADAILFLASERSAWITGEVLSVDGGHTLRGGPDVGLLLT